jgi:hypothetical protein
MNLLTILLSFLVIGLKTEAAIPPTTKLHKNILRNEGALQGGKAGGGFSLLDVRTTASAIKKTERVVIDVGNASMQKLKGSVGYYIVELKKNGKLVVNFSQTLNTKFNEKELVQKMKKSLYVKNPRIHFDPMGQNMILEMELKKPALVRVVAIRGNEKNTSKVVFDLAEEIKRK